MSKLAELYTQVNACTTLAASRDTLLGGILAMLDGEEDHAAGHATYVARDLRALTPHPDDPTRQISWIALLGEALTRNTSHVAVDPRHPGYAHAHKMLTETPELDKAAHIAALEDSLRLAGEEAAAYQRAQQDEREAHDYAVATLRSERDVAHRRLAEQALEQSSSINALASEMAQIRSAMFAPLLTGGEIVVGHPTSVGEDLGAGVFTRGEGPGQIADLGPLTTREDTDEVKP